MMVERATPSGERRRPHPLLGLVGACALSLLVGLGGALARPTITWWEPALAGALCATLASTALAAPSGDADWLHGLAGSLGAITLVECGLLTAAQWPALARLAGGTLELVILGELSALILVLSIAWIKGRLDVLVALSVAFGVSLAALVGTRMATVLGLLVGISVTGAMRSGTATTRLRATVSRLIWTVAALTTVIAMAAPDHAALLGGLILLLGLGLTLVWRRRWWVADVLMLLAWMAVVAMNYPSLFHWPLVGMTALLVLGETRYTERVGQRSYLAPNENGARLSNRG